MLEALPGIAILLVIVVGSLLCWRSEKRQYNNGYCSCGARWIHFDCDSQGGDGWKCTRCGAGMWTSWIRPKNIYYGKVVE